MLAHGALQLGGRHGRAAAGGDAGEFESGLGAVGVFGELFAVFEVVGVEGKSNIWRALGSSRPSVVPLSNEFDAIAACIPRVR